MTVTGKNGKPVNATPGVQGFQETTRPEGVKPANLVGADSPIARDLAVLEENRGRFENGYDSTDISEFASQFESVEFAAIWSDYNVSDGYCGDSEFVVREGSKGKWMRLHPDVSAFLISPDEAPVDLSHVTSLLSDQRAHEADEPIMMDDNGNFASYSDDVCRANGCFETLDDGEGWDGYCGRHGDLASQHEDGEHDEENPNDDCPECHY